MNIYCLRISISECPALISRLGYECGYPHLNRYLKTYPKIMDILVDTRGFLEIRVWICYGFSGQGPLIYHVRKNVMSSYMCRILKCASSPRKHVPNRKCSYLRDGLSLLILVKCGTRVELRGRKLHLGNSEYPEKNPFCR